MQRRSTISTVIFLLFTAAPTRILASSYASLEGAQAWQTKNRQRIPGEGNATTFDLADFSKGPFTLYRVYVGHRWGNFHELRMLYAPLEVELTGTFDNQVEFMGESFAPDVKAKALYKFNSYRLTYAHHWQEMDGWDLAAGFTAKVRDAEVRLTQGDRKRSKVNVGFVPLLNLQATREIASSLRFRADFDGLAAPQGRAFDLGIFIEHSLSTAISAFGGYRTVEGGADNKEVYNFAWFHSAVVGIRGSI